MVSGPVCSIVSTVSAFGWQLLWLISSATAGSNGSCYGWRYRREPFCWNVWRPKERCPFIAWMRRIQMCCGKNRQQIQRTSGSLPPSPANRRPTGRQSMLNIPRAPQLPVASSPMPNSPVALRYLQRSPIRVRGPVTGRTYDFSSSNPVQAVDTRDAATLMRTRFFRQD